MARGDGEIEGIGRRKVKFEFCASASSLRHIEDDTRRARTRGHRGLQVFDVRIERRDVERTPIVHDPVLRTNFVIPQSLVLPTRVAAEGDEVLRGAK